MSHIKFIAVLLTLLIIFTGCGNKSPLDPNKPVVITLWHNYGGQMEDSMNDLVEEFNSTVGKEHGIMINITSISSSSALYDKITSSANNDPGSSELPNITTGYPKSALTLMKKDKLVDLNHYFTKDELDSYMPRFVEEGIISDQLVVFPTAKSTEVLFLNKTFFERFSAETGVTMDSLSTFEGLADVAIKYYQWTDSKTPEIPNDGKAFYTSDSWFNLTQVGMRQLGDSFIKNENLNFTKCFNNIWSPLIEAAVKGGFAIYNGYSSDLAKTGEIVCSTGSTAGILFYGNTITYPDNTTEEVEYEVLPYPVLQGGSKIAVQRGGGMIVTKSSPAKEYASVVFLKWFTSPEQNMRFISETGYLPVSKNAFETNIQSYIEKAENDNVKKLLITALTMYNDYDFYTPPIFENLDNLDKNYSASLKQAAINAREQYLILLETKSPEEAYKIVSESALENFQ